MIDFFMSDAGTKLVLSLALIWLISLTVRHIYADAKLRRAHVLALEDLLHLMDVEDQHCKEHQLYTGKTLRTTMRRNARAFSNSSWSGKHTRTECQARLAKLKAEQAGLEGLLRLGVKGVFKFSGKVT